MDGLQALHATPSPGGSRHLGRQVTAEYYGCDAPLLASPERIEAVRIWRLLDRLWDKCKRQAIERAAGI